MGSVILSMTPEWLWLALGGFVAALGYGAVKLRQGRSQGGAEAMEADYENADDIRRRVSVDRAQRVRELDDAGYRD